MELLPSTDPPQICSYHLGSRLSGGDMGPVCLARARSTHKANTARRVSGFHTVEVVDASPGAVVAYVRDTEFAVISRLAG